MEGVINTQKYTMPYSERNDADHNMQRNTKTSRLNRESNPGPPACKLS